MLAHALWAGAGLTALGRRRAMTRKTVAWGVALAIVPDVVHTLPLVIAALTGAMPWHAWLTYAFAQPGGEPHMPAWVGLWSHHLHCVMHSAVVATGVTLVCRVVWGIFWLPLLGWWSHIVIDVFTHSVDYYAVPVFYPFAYWGFDGIAWTTPWFMALNYLALAMVFLILVRTRRTG